MSRTESRGLEHYTPVNFLEIAIFPQKCTKMFVEKGCQHRVVVVGGPAFTTRQLVHDRLNARNFREARKKDAGGDVYLPFSMGSNKHGLLPNVHLSAVLVSALNRCTRSSVHHHGKSHGRARWVQQSYRYQRQVFLFTNLGYTRHPRIHHPPNRWKRLE